MNRERLLQFRQTCALALACAMLAVLTANVASARPGQKNGKAKAASAASRNDEGYTKKIQEYTTEKFFLTELVDHLPASDKVPTPEKVLGYVMGTPEKLTHTKDQY
ncbi:MAG TPA: hypothetical protein VFO63_13445, partial [Blastocatellia bacterium]|nr:hypothetical protein [Blastocatellia bacterium]